MFSADVHPDPTQTPPRLQSNLVSPLPCPSSEAIPSISAEVGISSSRDRKWIRMFSSIAVRGMSDKPLGGWSSNRPITTDLWCPTMSLSSLFFCSLCVFGSVIRDIVKRLFDGVFADDRSGSIFTFAAASFANKASLSHLLSSDDVPWSLNIDPSDDPSLRVRSPFSPGETIA